MGIPTIYDRALQTLVKLTLEPEWEARFEPNSYGFRPGRSCHDAIEAIFNSTCKETKYILDADIAGCFDNINPVIRGWSNYFSTVCSKETLGRLDHLTWVKLWAWAIYRCPKTGRKEIAKKYWGNSGLDNWTFKYEEGNKISTLLKHQDVEIHRHIKVKGNNSPFNGETIYWSTRLGKNPEMPARITRLLKAQEGKCPHCGLFFREEDEMEVDHIIPKKRGGSNKRNNLQLLHKHCHDSKTTKDGSLDRSTHVKGLSN